MRSRQPPRLATWLLKRLVSDERRESLMGDLIEQFHHRPSRAWYWRQVLLAIAMWTVGDLWDHKRLAFQAVMLNVTVLIACHAFALAMYRRAAPWMNTRIVGSGLTRLSWSAWWIDGVPLLLAWFGGAFLIGRLMAPIHVAHRATTVFAVVVSQLLLTVLWAWPIWRHVQRGLHAAYTGPSEIFAVLILVGMPICALLGGLWRTVERSDWSAA